MLIASSSGDFYFESKDVDGPFVVLLMIRFAKITRWIPLTLIGSKYGFCEGKSLILAGKCSKFLHTQKSVLVFNEHKSVNMLLSNFMSMNALHIVSKWS